MIKKFLSRFHPRFVRSLVYMLQASEYHVGEYIRWYKRVEDFRCVENRKKLVWTLKSAGLYVIAWVLFFFLLALTIPFLFFKGGVGYVLFVIAVILVPYVFPYVLTVPLLILQNVIQRPIEWFIVRTATRLLKKHKGIKIGIAGSYGKTSMREILKTVLETDLTVAAPPHSYNTPLGISSFIKTLTGDEQVLLFEMGEYYPGDVKELCKLVRPDIGIITGVNEAHLEKFKTIDRTQKTIFELADWLGGTKPLYINGESDHAKRYAEENGYLNTNTFVYSRDGVGDTKVTESNTGLGGTTFTLGREEYTSKLLGLHQVGPLACAVQVAEHLRVPSEKIREGISSTVPFEHRLEPKTDSTGVVTLDDSYNGNPQGVAAVISFLGSLTGHRRLYVTPGLVEMGDRAELVHKDIGRQLAKAGIEQVILIRNSVTPFIEAGLQEAKYGGKITWYDEALKAFEALPHLTVSGDVVVLQNDWPDQYQ
ncbi:UDP-N-acetylmuramoyl-tripeptide--D-alanyl-D-alanine ligase [Candidatus Kaiserbacteria bacterium]|nr:UDP-N-acetylmuramoyl-tripeptide--D-alanyl-D-alanine ligase [Candidatus Kaiserbacteria bacterium]